MISKSEIEHICICAVKKRYFDIADDQTADELKTEIYNILIKLFTLKKEASVIPSIRMSVIFELVEKELIVNIQVEYTREKVVNKVNINVSV